MIRALRRLRLGRSSAQPAGETPPEPPAPAAAARGGMPEAHAPAGLLVRRQRLAEVFTPTQPQLAGELRIRPQSGGLRFIGRESELARILRSLREDRAHVVLYGERGRGKTSLANLAAAELRSAGLLVARYVCSATSDFDAILRGLFRDIPPRLLGSTAAAGGDAFRSSEALLPLSPLQPSDVFALPVCLRDMSLVMVVDEFDRITNEATRTAFADAIKQISDRRAPLSFMVIGVSDSLEQLLGRHPSIQRCVAGIPLPLLTQAEIEDVVARGGQEAGIEYPQAARTCISALARGVPYVAQLLSLRAGQAALDRGRTRVDGADLAAAIAAAIAEADPRVITLYDILTDAGRDAATMALLQAATAGMENRFGRFRAIAIGATGLELAGARVDPKPWKRLLDTGAIRPCVGTEPDLFTFADAMLPHYVLLRAVHDASCSRR